MTSIETPIGTEEAASILGISRPGVMDLIKRGKLVAHQPAPNQVWQVDKASVLARLEEQSKTRDARFSRDDVREIIREELGPILREEIMRAIREARPDLIKENAMEDPIEISRRQYQESWQNVQKMLESNKWVLVDMPAPAGRNLYLGLYVETDRFVKASDDYVTVLEEELRKQKAGE